MDFVRLFSTHHAWALSLFVAALVACLVLLHTPKNLPLPPNDPRRPSLARVTLTSFIISFGATYVLVLMFGSQDEYGQAVEHMIKDGPNF